MQKSNSRFTLKLCRDSIELLLESDNGEYLLIGSADPNNTKISEDLVSLRSQVQALSQKYPVVDVMLPDELILVQNLTIESTEKPVSATKALEMVSAACALAKDEINVAIGIPSSHRTQPVAAVTTKTINETRNFLNNAGFRTSRFIGSKPLYGFSGGPVFFKDPPPKESFNPFSTSRNIVVASVTFAIFIAVLFTFQLSFKSMEVTDQVNEITLPEVSFHSSTDQLKNENKKIAMSADIAPEINSSQKLDLSKNMLKGFFSLTVSPKKTLEKSTYQPRALSNLLENKNLLSSNLANLNPTELNTVPRLQQVYRSENTEYFSETPENSTLLEDYAKLQTLKSYIQFDYLHFIKPNFSNINETPVIKMLSSAKPIKRLKKHASVTESIPEPSLNRLGKVALNFVGQPSLITKKNTQEIQKNQINQSLNFDWNFTKLESSKNIFKQKSDIYNSNKQVKLKHNFAALTPRELLLSKKYEPIIRPSLIGRINVLAEPTLSSGAVTLSETPIWRPELVSSLSYIDPSDIKIIARATKKPSFPRRASIGNNATISNIIELNRTNLIGVFGTKQNAIALLRLASGKVIKVRVGDKFDGWQVLNISKDKIKLANGDKQEILRLPG